MSLLRAEMITEVKPAGDKRALNEHYRAMRSEDRISVCFHAYIRYLSRYVHCYTYPNMFARFSVYVSQSYCILFTKMIVFL